MAKLRPCGRCCWWLTLGLLFGCTPRGETPPANVEVEVVMPPSFTYPPPNEPLPSALPTGAPPAPGYGIGPPTEEGDLDPTAFGQLRTEAPADVGPREPLTRETLDRSLAAGRQYLLNSQREDGNFYYEFDFVAERPTQDDNEVRQAGAVWGLALIHRDHPTPQTKAAVEMALAYFATHSRVASGERRYVVYPGAEIGTLNTVAILVLALTDFLHAEPEHPQAESLRRQQTQYINLLLSQRMPNGRFYYQYDLETLQGVGDSSPYSDGEALLALAQAVNEAGRRDLQAGVVESAEEMYRHYVTEARKISPDSNLTKGFYQWASLAMYQMYDAGWPQADVYAQRTIELAHWMIDVHHTLERTRNTGYAYEGIVTAWELARRTDDEASREKFGNVINQGMGKLTTWQVGGPTPNAFIREFPTTDPRAVGGVMNGASDSILRIDVTQHQMHAVLLARQFIYK